MLLKAADQQSPPDESMYITDFGCKIRDYVPVPDVAERDPAPPQLRDVINCQCKAVGKKCSTEACGCLTSTLETFSSNELNGNTASSINIELNKI